MDNILIIENNEDYLCLNLNLLLSYGKYPGSRSLPGCSPPPLVHSSLNNLFDIKLTTMRIMENHHVPWRGISVPPCTSDSIIVC